MELAAHIISHFKKKLMKKIRQLSGNLAIIMAISVLFASCSSSTHLYTNPKGAAVYLNGVHVGKTPYTMTDTKITGTVTQLTFKKEGYEDFDVAIARNEELDVGALIGGILVLIPFLWIQKYQEAHTYDLVPLGERPVMDGPERLTTPETKISTSMADQIRELKQLLDEGLITQEEYNKAKTKILKDN